MTDFYIIRPGQTDSNTTHRHQPDSGRLTAVGRQQMETLGSFVQHTLRPTHILASRQVRALESAALLAQATHLVPSVSLDLEELLRPATLAGYSHRSARTVFYLLRWFFGLTQSTKSGGESYAAFLDRIDRVRSGLTHYDSQATVVVVSHAVTISFLVSVLERGRIRWWHWPQIWWRVFHIQNASVTHLHYDKTHDKWTLRSFNHTASTPT